MPNVISGGLMTQLNILFSELGLSQLISEPTHFRDHCNPICIDLVICDQPNIVVDSGIRSSLDESCKHQLTFCKFATKIPKIPPSKRLVWHYGKAKPELIQRALESLDWDIFLSNQVPDIQVKCLNETILNIMNNFVPSSSLSSQSDEPKWITKDIKNLMRKQKKIYKKYRVNGFKEDDKANVDRIQNECFLAVRDSREKYLKSLGNILIDKKTGRKTYWSIINTFLNR